MNIETKRDKKFYVVNCWGYQSIPYATLEKAEEFWRHCVRSSKTSVISPDGHIIYTAYGIVEK